MTNFPSARDDSASLPNPTAAAKTNNPSHSALHTDENAAIIAVETKLGTGSSTPASNTLLTGTGAGTSSWSTLTSAALRGILTDETGTGSAVFATSPTLVTPSVDAINESTADNGVTIDGLNIKDGKLNTNDSAVTANYTNKSVTLTKMHGGSTDGVLLTDANGDVTGGPVTNAKLATGAGEPGGAWTSWVPTWTNVTVGNGTVTAKYTQVGKTVKAKLTFILGSTSAISGDMNFTLPVTSVALIGSAAVPPIGIARFFDGASTVAHGYVVHNSTTQGCIRILNASATYVTQTITSSTAPFTFNTSDEVSISFEYEAA